MYDRMIICDINNNGIVRYKNKGEFVQVGVATTHEHSKLIQAIEYETYAPDGLQELIDYALLQKCIPNELFEFNIHYN